MLSDKKVVFIFVREITGGSLNGFKKTPRSITTWTREVIIRTCR